MIKNSRLRRIKRLMPFAWLQSDGFSMIEQETWDSEVQNHTCAEAIPAARRFPALTFCNRLQIIKNVT
jgi:hypothetical protein